MTVNSAVHVAVGVIRDGNGNILLTQRAKHAHQGGLWEFPGGKLEADETVIQALRRELREEVGITVRTAKPLIKINHRYPDLQVLLDVWQVFEFAGAATALEGQAMRWVAPHRLSDYAFPAANAPIITASRLPDRYAILEGRNTKQVLANLDRIIGNRVDLLQLRLKTLPAAEISAVYAAVLAKCRARGIQVLLNSDLTLSDQAADGLHLSSRALLACRSRPANYPWVAASCHNLAELRHAEHIGADFAVLAPVLPTSTHPAAQALGWETMAGLIAQVNLPVFALGGLNLDDMDRVLHAGAQGIAGISAFLS
ncbi:Nudix family hydrolase [Methylomonas rivi]|uniref:8-oxo-dGTP diphosphatase n=1 Tax=Methylomonas rivi TaxID=2952226 RepID=A0ABT1U2U3_9GAMM|nr:Nudix family hydrolase [Methylomonas sp. WSC-6]MCQ8127431.1 Nudix family hydrolase [Methylomonas sp. WSC-6]